MRVWGLLRARSVLAVALAAVLLAACGAESDGDGGARLSEPSMTSAPSLPQLGVTDGDAVAYLFDHVPADIKSRSVDPPSRLRSPR